MKKKFNVSLFVRELAGGNTPRSTNYFLNLEERNDVKKQYFRIKTLLSRLIAPQGFGPDSQNPRRHPRGPRVLGRKISQDQKKSRFFKNRARKVLPKLRWGSKKHSKESGSGVFARDSELEREELY